jgi:predicted GTPase/uncharacterized protein (DUF697 family)
MAQLKDELEQIMQQLSPPSIALIGRTGAGKSTLINAVFGKELAATGAGDPVSRNFQRYPQGEDDNHIVLYDSMGYETGEEDFINNIGKFLSDQQAQGKDKQIHLVWYVISASTKRVLPFDAEIIRLIMQRRIPIIIVIAQADTARPSEIAGMEQAIVALKSTSNITEVDLVKVSAEPLRDGDKPFGVKDLVGMTTKMLPKLYTEAFVVRQIASLDVKRKAGFGYIKKQAAICFGVGFVPIPLTSAAAALASQQSLVSSISALYGYTELAQILDSVGKFTTVSVISFLSTSVLDTISLLTGGASILFSGATSGAVSATYVATVGMTYISIFEKVTKKDLEGCNRQELEQKVGDLFKEEFRRFASAVKINQKDDLEKLDTLFR